MRGRGGLCAIAALAVAAGLAACAGQGPSPRAPDAGVDATAPAARIVEDLLARLDVLIAAGDEDGSASRARLAEARALRVEALAALASGDDALACDLLRAALALFGEGAP
jgi:hypothetical protein